MFKTVLDPQERKHSHMFWLAPVIVISLILVWRFNFSFYWFWIFVAYYTLFHNQRQGFGVMKWYESLNKKMHKETKFFFYAFTLFPFIIFHFRDTDFAIFYYISQAPLFHMDPDKIHLPFLFWNLEFHTPIHAALVGTWFLVLNIWLLWEINNYLRDKSVEWNRILAMVYYGGIYSYCFLICNSSPEILTLLIASHGLPYMFMLHKRTASLPSKASLRSKIPWILAALAIGGGILDYWYNVVIYEYDKDYTYLLAPTGWQLVLIIFYITPILCHFIWDSYLWKKGHPDGTHFYRS